MLNVQNVAKCCGDYMWTLWVSFRFRVTLRGSIKVRVSVSVRIGGGLRINIRILHI